MFEEVNKFEPRYHYKSNYKILRTFANQLIKAILEEEDGVRLFYPFKFIRIVGVNNTVRSKYLSYLHNKPIEYVNHHSENLRFKCEFFNDKERLNNQSVSPIFKYFKFIPSATFKRRLVKKIKDGEYTHWDIKYNYES